MGGYQNDGPFLGTLNIRGRSIIGIQKGTIILTTNHITIPWILFNCCKMGAAPEVWFSYKIALCYKGGSWKLRDSNPNDG